MSHFFRPISGHSPNDRAAVNPGRIFYVSNAVLLSYFDISGEISRQFKNDPEVISPPQKAADRGIFSRAEPCMAIV